MSLTFTVPLEEKFHENAAQLVAALDHVEPHPGKSGTVKPPDGNGLVFTYAAGPGQHELTITVIENPENKTEEEIRPRILSEVQAIQKQIKPKQ